MSTSIQEPRRVFTELHNTLPRSSKSEDDLLSRGQKAPPISSPVKEKPSSRNTDEKKVG